MHSARKKPTNLALIGDLKQADAALAEIAEIERRLAVVEATMNDGIDKLKANAQKLSGRLQQRIDTLANGLHAFAEHHRSDIFEKHRRRTVALTFGLLGFRTSTEVQPLPKLTWKKVLDVLEKGGYDQAIRVKKEVDRDALHTFPDDELADMGVRRVPKDTFWYETHKQAVEDGAA